MQNISDILSYSRTVDSGTLPIARGVELTEDDKLRREIIMSLMGNMQAKIDPEYFISEIEALNPYFEQGAVTLIDNVLTIQDQAREIMRIIVSVFDRYLEDNKYRYSGAV